MLRLQTGYFFVVGGDLRTFILELEPLYFKERYTTTVVKIKA